MTAADEDTTRTIHIPSGLYAQLEPLAAEGDFKTVDGYVAFVLSEVVAPDDEPGGGMSAEQREQVMERLRNLGYA